VLKLQDFMEPMQFGGFYDGLCYDFVVAKM
jgi:hypothetical protein